MARVCLAQRPGGARADVEEYIGRPLPDVTVVDADGRPFTLSALRGSYSVVTFGCLTWPPFLRNVSRVDTVYRDYAPKGVRDYYVYRRLAHPDLNGYIDPHTLEERPMHVREARRTLGSETTWLADTMETDVERAVWASEP
ncbi:hypothetical protein HN371_16345 [Candidatus Poribacteria bacterium]|jgi:hypothetical protein|nr:hypothetical protein [Candidatus Poribacteria bacterium]MBT5535690.1 hypothetical protein [Candidatus Poribacteria bacterium]MBT5710221.1 hypothetical protein [Candidatus Poribacteria bacterium]MBT7101191.1 hypothetical protein [Candidatus Poribacteria bacterium]MBT7808260.1 hypothetical protein [Candidatus Poribacteria bacterium]